MENKLKEIINRIVREEILGEDQTAFVTTARGRDAISYKDTKELDAIKGNSDVKGIETASGQRLKEMARMAEVKYSLKTGFRGNLESVQSKLSKSEFRSLVDIVKVLKDKGTPLTATDILKFHNEANPDRPYTSQQSFIRPLVIGAIGKKKISYDDLPFSASQRDVSTGFEKATGVITPSHDRSTKFNRDLEYTAATQSNPDYALPTDRADLAAKTLDYKRAREAYRKADNAESKQQYVDKMRKMVATDDNLGQEIAQQYADGLIQTQDPVTLELSKKFRVTKRKYGTLKISDKETRDAAALIGAEDDDEED
jgi:hypothetical protein